MDPWSILVALLGWGLVVVLVIFWLLVIVAAVKAFARGFRRKPDDTKHIFKSPDH